MLIDVQSLIKILEKIESKFVGQVHSDEKSKVLTQQIIENIRGKEINTKKFVKIVINSYFECKEQVQKIVEKEFITSIKISQQNQEIKNFQDNMITICSTKQIKNKKQINHNVFSLTTSLYSQKSTEKRKIKQKNKNLNKRVVSKGSLPKSITNGQQNNIFVNMQSQQSLQKKSENKKQTYPTQNFIVNFFDFCSKPKRFDISSSVQRYYQSYQSRPISKKNKNHNSYKKLQTQQQNVEKYSFQDVFSKNELFQSQAKNQQVEIKPLTSLMTPKRNKKKSLKLDAQKSKTKNKQRITQKPYPKKQKSKKNNNIIDIKMSKKFIYNSRINKLTKLPQQQTVIAKPKGPKKQKIKIKKKIINNKKVKNLNKTDIKDKKQQSQIKDIQIETLEQAKSDSSSNVEELSPSQFANDKQSQIKGIDFINNVQQSEESQDSLLLMGNLSPIDSKSELIIPLEQSQKKLQKLPSLQLQYSPLQSYEHHNIKQEFEGKDYTISFGTFIKNSKEVLQTRKSQNDFKRLIKDMINYLNKIGIINKCDNDLKKASFVKENFDFKIVQMSVLVNEIKNIFKNWTEISITKIKLLLKKSNMS